VDAQSVRAGIALARWFGQEAKRVYAALAEDEEARERRLLAEWVARKGGTVTPRELQMGNRRYRDSAESAEQALDELVEAAAGHWVDIGPTDQGGRPTRAFQLFGAVNVNGTSPEPEESQGSVDVDSKDKAEGAGAEEASEDGVGGGTWYAPGAEGLCTPWDDDAPPGPTA
jgi:hypothetical protein